MLKLPDNLITKRKLNELGEKFCENGQIKSVKGQVRSVEEGPKIKRAARISKLQGCTNGF